LDAARAAHDQGNLASEIENYNRVFTIDPDNQVAKKGITDAEGRAPVAEPQAQGKAGAGLSQDQTIAVDPAVQNSKLVKMVQPVSSPMARAAGVQGTVRLRITVGTDGSLKGIQVISGPPMLQQSAIEAVRQWKYSPTIVGGTAVRVVTTVDLAFGSGH